MHNKTEAPNMMGSRIEQSEISRESDFLDREVAQVHENARNLRERLSPVIRQIPVNPNKSGCEPPSTLCPLADNLRRQREGVASSNQILQEILETLAI